MKLFKRKKDKPITNKQPEPRQLITALVQIGDQFAEVVGRAHTDPSFVVHEWENSVGFGKSLIISWKPIETVTPKVIKSVITQDEKLNKTVEQCLNRCSTGGLMCYDCDDGRPHHHFYFAKSNNARGFDVVSYPCLNIGVWQDSLENEDEYFIDWVKPEYWHKKDD